MRGGLFLTAGAWGDEPVPAPPPDVAVEAFLHSVEAIAALGVSCVVEYLVRAARPQDLERLVAAGDVVVLSTWCRDPLGRFAARNRTDRLLERQPVLDALGYADADEHTIAAVERMRVAARAMQRDFDVPVLHVNTDDGYDPDLDCIIDFVTS